MRLQNLQVFARACSGDPEIQHLDGWHSLVQEGKVIVIECHRRPNGERIAQSSDAVNPGRFLQRAIVAGIPQPVAMQAGAIIPSGLEAKRIERARQEQRCRRVMVEHAQAAFAQHEENRQIEEEQFDWRSQLALGEHA